MGRINNAFVLLHLLFVLTDAAAHGHYNAGHNDAISRSVKKETEVRNIHNDSEGDDSGSMSLLEMMLRALVYGGSSKQHHGKKDNKRQMPSMIAVSSTRRIEQDDDAGGDDDDNDNNDDNDDVYAAKNAENVNNLCSEYLLKFLEGTSDAHDMCGGIKNAYTAANCAADDEEYEREYDIDDYFGKFTEHTCCATLLTHYGGYCATENLFTYTHMILAAMALMLAEIAKGLTKYLEIHCIPEAGICALVGTIFGLIASLIPGADIDDLSFDDDLFMKFLLPPIIFEAALSVSKIQFRKRRSAILIIAILGTLISTALTGLMVHYISSWTRGTTFPMLDSLVFGALISSVDPVAILSVLTNLGLSQTDTVFILVFGESLLNDGIAITVFKTLVSRFDGRTHDDSTTVQEVFGVIADFLNAFFGSIIVAIVCGVASWFYFKILKKTLSPAMEVGSFFLWAYVPFYMSEALEWSGIVSLVSMGFFMDIYIASPKIPSRQGSMDENCNENIGSCNSDYVTMASERSTAERSTVSTAESSIAPLDGTERMRLSREAEKHIRFVAHLAAQLAENAIFAYLGLFLFSQHYVWDPTMISIAIFSCLISRAFMVVFLSQFILMIYSLRGRGPSLRGQTAAAIEEPRTQLVLILAGLRGAVSLALMVDIPIYNALTGEGCEYKGLMKGMTSSTIIFTTFILGGGAYYILPRLGFKSSEIRQGLSQTSSGVMVQGISQTSSVMEFQGSSGSLA